MSNLLQKASIITTPTAYDTGKILSVKPVQYYGPELVTNGDFSNGINSWQGTDASSLLSVVLGELKIENGDGSSAGANSSITTEIGKEYRITFVSNKGTAVEGVFFGAGTSTNSVNLLDVTDNFDGIHTETFTATTTITWFIAKTLSTVNGQFSYIDNVSVKEVINADFDFTRNSSATRVGSNGLIQDVASNLPRIDYTGGVGSWKFEPQRSNLVPYSEDFSNAAWIKGGVTVNANQAISPDGTLNADLMQVTVNLGNIYDNVSGSGDGSFSVFAKYIDIKYIRLRSTNSYAYFDIENGTIGNTLNVLDTKIENYGNGWYRCTVIGNNTNSLVQVFASNTDSGQPTGLGSVYLWGAQFEQGSYATSYIRSNTGSVTTRLADVANNAGSSDLINSTEGVLYAEISALANDNNYRVIAISDGNTSNRVVIDYSNTNKLRAFYAVNNILSAFFDIDYDIKQSSKILIKYKVNDFQFWVNGFKLGSDNSGAVLTGNTLNTLNFNFGGSSGGEFYGNTKCVAVFKEALTDLELECLVSWMSFSDLGINFGYTVE